MTALPPFLPRLPSDEPVACSGTRIEPGPLQKSRVTQKPFGQKPFGLSLSKAFSSLSKKGKRFDKLTANGVVLIFADECP